MCASTSVVSTPGYWRCTLAIALHDQVLISFMLRDGILEIDRIKKKVIIKKKITHSLLDTWTSFQNAIQSIESI